MKSKGRQGRSARALLYKVVELSTVDESAIERTLNEWVPQGWKLDGIQFAIRESSRRPAMAFVLFTREGPAVRQSREAPAKMSAVEGRPAVSAWDRLAQLAEDDDA